MTQTVNTPVTIRFDPDVYRQLRAIAQAEDRSLGSLVRRITQEYVKEHGR
jgi:predicted transcriptional regulator